jgi:succinate-semialdehyde dehydrogenase/glutarate-semialdehyde dehydrogenase
MSEYPALHMIIDGEKVSGGGRRTFDVVNPVTGEPIGALPLAEAADLDRALETAAKGFKIWRKSTPQERAAVLTGAARLMVERQEELARLATIEQGKPLAAGCSVIMKAAEETPASALGVLQCLLDAGLPKEVAQAVFGVPDEVSRHLLGSPVIRKLSFTGSTVVGKHLAKLAAEDMKRTTMELGGHGPVLVFGDADLDKALDTAVAGKYRNCGQVCVSPTRFIVEENVFEKFRDGFVERAKRVKVGDGLVEGTQMGPMANPRRPEAMDRLIGDATAKGATLHTGGERIGNQGYFYAPSVLSEIPLEAQIMNEEPFGPVALINPFKGEEEMIAEANRLPYGLAAYAWTSDVQRQRRLAAEIETGMLGINSHMIGGADAPFGGVKWSGHGSEDGPEGVLACMVLKAVHEG